MESTIKIPDDMLFDDRLSRGDIRVYGALTKIAAGSNVCIASKKQIAKVSGMDKIVRYTKNLAQCKYISIVAGKNGKVNSYHLPLVEVQPVQPIVDRLSSYMEEYLRYSAGVHSPATTRTYASCMRELIAFAGDLSIKAVDVRTVEQFLGHKKNESLGLYITQALHFAEVRF